MSAHIEQAPAARIDLDRWVRRVVDAAVGVTLLVLAAFAATALGLPRTGSAQVVAPVLVVAAAGGAMLLGETRRRRTAARVAPRHRLDLP